MISLTSSLGIYLPTLNTEKFSNKLKSLQIISEECLVNHLYPTLIEKQYEEKSFSQYRIRDSINFIQPIICNSLIEKMMCSSHDVDHLLLIFSDSNKFNVQRLCIRNRELSIESLSEFTSHQPSFAKLKVCSCKIKDCVQDNFFSLMFPRHLVSIHLREVEFANDSCEPLSHEHDLHNLSKFKHPNLKHLRFSNVDCARFMVVNKHDPPALAYLELSDYGEGRVPASLQPQIQRIYNGVAPAEQNGVEFDFDYLLMQGQRCNPDDFQSSLLQFYRIKILKSTLKSLVLHNTIIGRKDMEAILQLENLEHLDLSMSVSRVDCSTNHLYRPQVPMHKIVESLPKLKSLDLSSTIIGSNIVQEATGSQVESRAFWEVFTDRKLQFLGILNCRGSDFGGLHHIAEEVAGGFTAAQIITSLEQYQDRKKEFIYASKCLYHFHYESTPENNVKIIKLLMESVDRFPNCEKLWINYCVNVYGLIKVDSHFNLFHRREMVRYLARALDVYDECFFPKVVKLALLTLEYFSLPIDCGPDIYYVMDRILKVLQTCYNEDIGKIAIHICNNVCIHVQDAKSLMAHTRFVEIIMSVIRRKVEEKRSDETMILCYGTLWNVSDETPENSEKFIRNGGIQLLMDCFSMPDANDDVRKSAIGLVGNIAEVQYLRPHIMRSDLIELIALWTDQSRLSYPAYDIELAYHACGTLSHLLSDGESAWTIATPTRQSVCEKVMTAVNSWNIDCPRYVNYRSFSPILGLIHRGVKEASHWAIWALLNLIQYDGDYRRILEREGAYEILTQVTTSDSSKFYSKTCQLARKVIELMGRSSPTHEVV